MGLENVALKTETFKGQSKDFFHQQSNNANDVTIFYGKIIRDRNKEIYLHYFYSNIIAKC